MTSKSLVRLAKRFERSIITGRIPAVIKTSETVVLTIRDCQNAAGHGASSGSLQVSGDRSAIEAVAAAWAGVVVTTMTGNVATVSVSTIIATDSTFRAGKSRARAFAPYGGYKGSGYGREMGFTVMREVTQEKSVWISVR